MRHTQRTKSLSHRSTNNCFSNGLDRGLDVDPKRCGRVSVFFPCCCLSESNWPCRLHSLSIVESKSQLCSLCTHCDYGCWPMTMVIFFSRAMETLLKFKRQSQNQLQTHQVEIAKQDSPHEGSRKKNYRYLIGKHLEGRRT